MDYWEDSCSGHSRHGRSFAVGLRAAADIARQQGDDTKRVYGRCGRSPVDRDFGRLQQYGFPRVAFDHSGIDAAVTFLGPPFADPDSPSGAQLRSRRSRSIKRMAACGWDKLVGCTRSCLDGRNCVLRAIRRGHRQRPLSDVLGPGWLRIVRAWANYPSSKRHSRPVSVAPLAWTMRALAGVAGPSQQLANVPVPGSPQD